MIFFSFPSQRARFVLPHSVQQVSTFLLPCSLHQRSTSGQKISGKAGKSAADVRRCDEL